MVGRPVPAALPTLVHGHNASARKYVPVPRCTQASTAGHHGHRLPLERQSGKKPCIRRPTRGGRLIARLPAHHPPPSPTPIAHVPCSSPTPITHLPCSLRYGTPGSEESVGGAKMLRGQAKTPPPWKGRTALRSWLSSRNVTLCTAHHVAGHVYGTSEAHDRATDYAGVNTQCLEGACDCR